MYAYVEDVVDSYFLPLAAPEKGNFLGVMDKCSLGCSVLPFKSLLASNKFSERRGNHFEHKSWEQVPGDDDDGARPPHNLSQFPWKQNDIKWGFGEVGVDSWERIGPFLDISAQSLVGVGYSAVQVAQLIVDHIFKVGVVEEIGQSSSESQR